MYNVLVIPAAVYILFPLNYDIVSSWSIDLYHLSVLGVAKICIQMSKYFN